MAKLNWETQGKLTSQKKFNVDIEDSNGTSIVMFEGIPAQTKAEAIAKVKAKLVFTALREDLV